MKRKMYLIGRADLDPGLRAAQVGHAAFAFAVQHPWITRRWHPNYLILVEVDDHLKLEELVADIKRRGLRHSLWCEPDLDGELTAVAVAPSRRSRKMLRGLPLMLANTSPVSSTTERLPLKRDDEGLSPSPGAASTPSEFVDWR